MSAKTQRRVVGYRLRRESGDVIECDRCNSPAPTVEHKWDDLGRTTPIPDNRRAHEYLCQFCYETHLGNILKYDHHRDDKNLALAIAQAFNLLAAHAKQPKRR